MQYDGRPDGRFGVSVGTWTTRILSGKRDVCEELKWGVIGVCCLLGSRILGMDGQGLKVV